MKVTYGIDCKKCGKRFESEDPNAIYCPECKVEGKTDDKKAAKKKDE